MSVFDTAMAVFFQDENMAVPATYRAGGTGSPVAVRVIFSAPDQGVQWNEVRSTTATMMIDVQVADVPTPAEGDQFDLRGITYDVQGVPVRDDTQLVWTIELVEA